jgi:hypothetical protein
MLSRSRISERADDRRGGLDIGWSNFRKPFDSINQLDELEVLVPPHVGVFELVGSLENAEPTGFFNDAVEAPDCSLDCSIDCARLVGCSLVPSSLGFGQIAVPEQQ